MKRAEELIRIKTISPQEYDTATAAATATVAHLQQSQMGNATGIYNLMRNLGILLFKRAKAGGSGPAAP